MSQLFKAGWRPYNHTNYLITLHSSAGPTLITVPPQVHTAGPTLITVPPQVRTADRRQCYGPVQDRLRRPGGTVSSADASGEVPEDVATAGR